MFQDAGNSILQALNDSLEATANFLPNLLAALVIFIVGVLIASILRGILVRILEAISFEKALSTTGIPQALKKAEKSLELQTI